MQVQGNRMKVPAFAIAKKYDMRWVFGSIGKNSRTLLSIEAVMYKTIFRPNCNVARKQPRTYLGKVDAPHFTRSELEPIAGSII